MIGAALTALSWGLKNWKLVAAAVAALGLIAAFGWYGHVVRSDERAKQDKASLNNMRDRSAVDDEIRIDDEVALCLRLNPRGDCRSLRHGR